MKSVRAELADAVRALNAAYRRLPDPEAVDLFGDDLLELEAAIGREMLAGNDPAARLAIRTWRNRHLTNFKKTGGAA